jgi:hypothetical protein
VKLEVQVKRSDRILPLVLFLAASWFSASPSHAGPEDQNRFGANLQFMGLTFHPDGGENEGYPRQLDDGAFWVLQIGLQGDVDWYAHRFALLRFSTSLVRDCADVWSGFFHLGPRANVPVGDRFVFRIGIGPTFIWREQWYGVVPGYKRDSFYGDDTTGTFQHRFIWHGGNVDLEWKIRRDISFIYSVVPGWPEVITSSFGARYSF